MTEKEWRMIFADRLKGLLEREGMSQADFAEHMEITDSAVSKYVHGRHTPKISTLLRMCSVLDCELVDLIC